MRVIPDEIFTSVRSGAERRVHAALKALPDDRSIALHSVNLPEHDYKRLGEIDFLVITPEVLLTVEVKGGRVTHRDGRWSYGSSRRRGSPEGPFSQARSAMHSLENRLKQVIGVSKMARVASGFLVITPDVDLPPSAEWAPETYLGATAYDEGRGLEQALRKARRYWPPKNRHTAPAIPAPLLRELVRAIRPDFERVPSLAVRSRTLDESFRQLTEDQYHFIDVFEENDRTLCYGGAGSGKTFLAAEAARRWANSGLVLLTCTSPLLASFLKDVLRDESNVVVTSFEALGHDPSDAYDGLIVDEAQDLMTFDHLDTLDRILRGGLDAGQWLFLTDPNNQVLDLSRFDREAFGHLTSLHPARVRLRSNCRNTSEIVNQTQVYTGADIGVAKAGTGDPVMFCDVQGSTDEASRLDDHLDTLFEGQVAPREITVVSVAGSWETTSARGSRWFGKMVRLSEQLRHPRNRVTWASVDEVKGLENRFVCIVDLPPEIPTNRLAALYVAMTRPRIHLWIACRPDTAAVLEKLALANL